jgi:hypothetical protein
MFQSRIVQPAAKVELMFNGLNLHPGGGKSDIYKT